MALLAGGGPGTALRLGLSMVALQFAIGALNDIVDAPRDMGRQPPKPIPSGAASVATARRVAVGFAAAGLALAAPSGPALVGLGVVVLAIGAAYDLFAKGTPWSWLPFAVGIPLLPVYGWLGATGGLAPFLTILVPMAGFAGGGLAIANARADLHVDRGAGTRSVATALGPARSLWAGAALMAMATVVGLAFVGRVGWTAPIGALVVGGTALVVAGLAVGAREDAGARRQAWTIQAIGAAIAAAGWVAGMVPRP